MTPDEEPEELDEIEEIEPRSSSTDALWKKLAVTVLGLALYVALARIPLPGVTELEPGLRQFLPSIGIFSLGLTPLIVGFLLVELFAVLIPAGGRLREGGLAGRARLSRIALGLGLGLAMMQGLGVGRFLTTVVSPSGFSYVADPGPGFVFLTMLTLTAATAGLWVLGSFLSRAGLGNGFCLLIVFKILEPVVRSFLGQPEPPFTLLAAPLAVAVLLAFFLSRAERGEEGHLPALPQGIIPVIAVAFSLPWLRLPSLLIPRLAVPLPPSWTETALLLVLVPLLSWVAYLAVSGPSRLANELPGAPEEAAWIAAVLRRRLPLAIVVLTLGAAGLAALKIWRPEMPAPLTFIGIAMVVATLFDLAEEVRFTARHGRTGRVLSLDNVYLAWHLTEVLADGGIDALPRARRFRSLFFFFLPLVKIDLLVPADQLEEARELIAGEDLAVV